MASRKFFISLETKRKLGFGGAVASGLGFLGFQYLPNSLGLDKYKEFIQTYKDGKERQLSEKVIQRFHRAIDIMQINDYEKKFLHPFMVYGFDLYHLGSTKMKSGGHLGIPVNYTYDSRADIEKAEIRLLGELVDWNSSYGRQLEDSLMLTEDEQVFGMAKEISDMATHKILFKSAYPPITIMFVYGMAVHLNQKFGLLTKPFSVRGVLYFLLAGFGYGCWSFLNDYTEVSYEIETDKKLATLGADVIDAGIRFYDKLLKKNIAIRHLTNDTSTFTAYGNLHFLLRQKSLPLTTRKAFFEMRLKEANGETNGEEPKKA